MTQRRVADDAIHSLRRQHSMKSSSIFYEDTGTAIRYSRPHTATITHTKHRSPVESNRTVERTILNSPLSGDTQQIKSALISPTDASPNAVNIIHLSVMDQTSSGHSSMAAASRVSQQPSFDSYDSSMSNQSWTSSLDPDASDHQYSGCKSKKSSPLLQNDRHRRGLSATKRGEHIPKDNSPNERSSSATKHNAMDSPSQSRHSPVVPNSLGEDTPIQDAAPKSQTASRKMIRRFESVSFRSFRINIALVIHLLVC